MDTISLKDIFIYIILPLCAFIAHQVWSINGSVKGFTKGFTEKIAGHEKLDDERHTTLTNELKEIKAKI